MIEIGQVKLMDLIPPNLRDDEKVRAATESIDSELKQVTDMIPGVAIVHHIDTLPEEWVDQLAWQWHVDFYNPSLPLEQKRELVRNSLRWHKRKGTPSAVAELITTIFGSGQVIEWWEYGGEPYHFKVTTSDPTATSERAQEFLAAIDSVKNARSWLDSIEITTEGLMNLVFGFPIHTGDYITARQVV